MQCTIHSRILGRTLTFERPGRRYVYWDIQGGTTRDLCKPTRSSGGEVLTYSGHDQAEFERACWHWYRRFMNGYQVQNALLQESLLSRPTGSGKPAENTPQADEKAVTGNPPHSHIG